LGNIGINSVRKIRNNGIVIECNDKTECLKLENNINTELKDICNASLPTKRNPRLIIYNINNDKDSTQSVEDQMNGSRTLDRQPLDRHPLDRQLLDRQPLDRQINF
jgi:hypothetical protein